MDKNKKVIDVYNKISKKYFKTFDSGAFSDKKFLDKFLAYLKKGSGVLDLGCGTGRHCEYMAKKAMLPEGVDLAREMLKIAKRSHPEIKFRLMDMRKLSYPRNSFDAVWAGYSLFHINRRDFAKTISLVKKIIKPGGYFGLVMQEGEGDLEIAEPLLPKEKIYLWLYSAKDLKDILNRYGFTVISQMRKKPKSEKEFSFNKLLIIARKKVK